MEDQDDQQRALICEEEEPLLIREHVKLFMKENEGKNEQRSVLREYASFQNQIKLLKLFHETEIKHTFQLDHTFNQTPESILIRARRCIKSKISQKLDKKMESCCSKEEISKSVFYPHLKEDKELKQLWKGRNDYGKKANTSAKSSSKLSKKLTRKALEKQNEEQKEEIQLLKEEKNHLQFKYNQLEEKLLMCMFCFPSSFSTNGSLRTPSQQSGLGPESTDQFFALGNSSIIGSNNDTCV